jgi:hypothetical protein
MPSKPGSAEVQLHLRVAGLDAVGGVAAGPRQGVRVALDRVHHRPGQLVGQREGDRAAAGAQVDAQRVRHALQGVDGVLDDRLGLRPRHEDARADLERDVAEADAAGQVLERHPVRAAGDQLLEGRGLRRVELVDHQQVGRLGEAEDVHGERPCVVVRARDPGGGEPPGGVLHGRPQGGHAGSSPASLAAVSASTSDWMTGSRSPSSTCIRLLAL